MTRPSTRDALLEQGALLFARRGVEGVTTRELHDAVGARNESALHYHFGDRAGLVGEILRVHLLEIEARRAALVATIAADDRMHDLRTLVHALAAPMADDLESPLGRAHLRLVARVSPPALAYERPFRVVDAPAGVAVVQWIHRALAHLPEVIRRERLVTLRAQLIGLFAIRAELLDDRPDGKAGDRPELCATSNELFLANLLDSVVAGLAASPSPESLAAAGAATDPGPSVTANG